MPGLSCGPARATRALLLAALAIAAYPVAPAGAVRCGGGGGSAADQYCDPFGDVTAGSGAPKPAATVSAQTARRARRLGPDGAAVLGLAVGAGRPALGVAGPAAARRPTGRNARGGAGRAGRAGGAGGARSLAPGRSPPAVADLPPAATRTESAGPRAGVGLLAVLGALAIIVLGIAGLDARRR
ncbi:MAG: hypothetical protein ACXVFT_03875 [Solirubrobacteraceae bacterium]